ncbi:MAG: PEP/pyruvate-binding domain-containing protein [Leeuwenhoekiella sp.]
MLLSKRFAGFFLVILSLNLSAQQYSNSSLQSTIKQFKADPRGPYQRIRWFCEDGSMREPRDPCPDGIDGVQHASYKDITNEIAAKNHLYFGEILASANKDNFWDAANNQSRLKQYQLGKYLASVDDGWILRKAQYYRGAFQSEDEAAWGIDFYKGILKNDTLLQSNYYLIRQSLKDIPHSGDDNLAQRLRSESKIIAEDFPQFMDIRVKIHGQPDINDIVLVREFREKYKDKFTPELKKQFEDLNTTLTEYYAPLDINGLKKQVQNLSGNPDVKTQLISFTATYNNESLPQNLIPEISELLCNIRTQINQIPASADRLQLLEISLKLEEMLLKKVPEWETPDLKSLLDKIYYLSYATAGTGLTETWEWEEISSTLYPIKYNDISLGQLNSVLTTARNVVQWSAAMAKANYDDVVNKYVEFEPLASGFIDDRIRSSVALPLGKAVGELGNFIAEESKLQNEVLDINEQSTIRGLNPGYAMGELVVVAGNPDKTEVSPDKIYIFKRPPSDLKPVAGIATVDEGNLVSHVQLLARNLGIPNAAITDEDLDELLAHNGEKVFYAVSDKGTVIIKPAADMTETEQALFSKEERSRNKIAVPIDQIRLEENSILNMRDIDASASGKLAGPKAANLGQLKKMFPDQVVEGLVLPFGIFREHMDLPMPGQNKSYWQFLNNMFATADIMRGQNTSESEVEAYQLKQLEILRAAIKDMKLKDSFISSIRANFKSVFGENIGKIPVFLRSDTNMEDLKEFTGAGLNLTLFNVVEEDKIIAGIKEVWASPYTERSFKWRQQYLSNPENVFPSILVIPSVDVDYSGVMITKGINKGTDEDLTVAFSRGAGGAVDGQAAETRLITKEGSYLLAPARQADYIRLPLTGGTKPYHTTFEKSFLNEQNIEDIRKIAQLIRTRIPEETQSDYNGAYDVELGFKDNKLYLFQIRPFVENKNALSSGYLESISPKIDYDRYIDLSSNVN